MRRDDLERKLEYKIKNIKNHKGICVAVNLFNNNSKLIKCLFFVAYAADLDKFILAFIVDSHYNYSYSEKPEDQELIGLELTKDELIEFAAQPDHGADVFYAFPDAYIARGKAK